MPLVQCPACERQVSTEAHSCPNCGHPSPGRSAHPAPSPQVLDATIRSVARCFDCGCDIPEGHVRRRRVADVRETKVQPKLMRTKVELTTRHSVVDLCPSCDGKRQEWVAVGVVVGLIAAVALIAFLASR